MMGNSPPPFTVTAELVAKLIFSACKGEKKLPPIDQVVLDFPAEHVLQARYIFIAKMDKVKPKDKSTVTKCIKRIEKRFKLKNVVVRSPSPALHRLLKGETGDDWT